MSAIDDYGCDVAGCHRVADELVETDDVVRVLLCRPHHDKAEADAVTLDSGRVLYWDDFSGWALMPEPAPMGGKP